MDSSILNRDLIIFHLFRYTLHPLRLHTKTDPARMILSPNVEDIELLQREEDAMASTHCIPFFMLIPM